MKVIYSERALRRVHEIESYIAKDNSRGARRVLARIFEATDRLAFFPDLGRPGGVAGTRELGVSRTRYVVIYLVSGGVVRVIDVLHGAQRR